MQLNQQQSVLFLSLLQTNTIDLNPLIIIRCGPIIIILQRIRHVIVPLISHSHIGLGGSVQ